MKFRITRIEIKQSCIFTYDVAFFFPENNCPFRWRRIARLGRTWEKLVSFVW